MIAAAPTKAIPKKARALSLGSENREPSTRARSPVPPAANRGTRGSGANLVAVASASRAARQTGDANRTIAQTRSAATSVSFELDWSA